MSNTSLICFICPIIFLKETRTNISEQALILRPLMTKKSSKVTFVLEAIYKKDGVFKYPKAFQCDNGLKFKEEVTQLLEKHNVEI